MHDVIVASSGHVWPRYDAVARMLTKAETNLLVLAVSAEQRNERISWESPLADWFVGGEERGTGAEIQGHKTDRREFAGAADFVVGARLTGNNRGRERSKEMRKIPTSES